MAEVAEAAAYVAGLFDGEGSVGYPRQKTKTPQRNVRIGNTDPVLIDACAEALDLLGIEYRRYLQQTSKGRPWHLIQVHKKAAMVSFHHLIPFRSPGKRERLQRIVEEVSSHR